MTSLYLEKLNYLLFKCNLKNGEIGIWHGVLYGLDEQMDVKNTMKYLKKYFFIAFQTKHRPSIQSKLRKW